MRDFCLALDPDAELIANVRRKLTTLQLRVGLREDGGFDVVDARNGAVITSAVDLRSFAEPTSLAQRG